MAKMHSFAVTTPCRTEKGKAYGQVTAKALAVLEALLWSGLGVMTGDFGIPDTVVTELSDIYEEIMWLSKRQRVKPSVARGWYTHARAAKLTSRLRRFTGKVSKEAMEDNAVLRLEHFKRIQTTLTQLVQRHLSEKINDAAEFVRVVIDCEQVHIVTNKENYAAMAYKSDYILAGIELIDWSGIPVEMRAFLWRKMLRGKVSNASDFPH